MTRVALVTSVLLVSGCAGAGGLAGQLGKARGELKVEAGPTVEARQAPSLSLGEVVVEPRLPPATVVEKTGGYAVPLLLVNFWRADYRCTLGAAQVDSDLADFIRRSVKDGLRRGSHHPWAEAGGELTVDVDVRKLAMDAPMREAGHLLVPIVFFIYQSGVSAGPARVTLEAEVVVRRGGAEVARRAVAAHGTATTPPGRPPGRAWHPEDYTPTMAAAVSGAVQDLRDQVVGVVDGL